MTDSMKFGPEWLRNMSNDMGTGSGTSASNSTTAPLGPRTQLAEYRYGREEMLSLFDKNLKIPEILPTFKKLYVDKVQCPLALTPSTEDEVVNSTRPWVLRSPVSFGAPNRGAGRGGSVDRGRGRSRGAFHTLINFQRPAALYDEDIRGLGKVERGWPERNGGSEPGTTDWNGSPSSSPRKEYNTHGRSNMENWRRNRTEDDSAEGWRGTSSSTNNSTYRWSRSTSWRDDDTSTSTGNNSDQVLTQMSRSFSSSGNSILDRSSSSSSNSAFKTNTNNSQNDVANKAINNVQWDQDDILPEWAMENPSEGGGSFDASGAFHGPNEENNDESVKKNQRETNKTDNKVDQKNKDEISNEISVENAVKKEDDNSELATEEERSEELIECNVEESTNTNNSNATSTKTDEDTNSEMIQDNSKTVVPESQTSKLQTQQQQQNTNTNIATKPHFSEISDRMQEVADDMVEKLIMDDEVTTTKKSLSSSSSSVSILKTNTITNNSSTTPSLMQQPLVNNHPLMPQSQPPPTSELWYYRDPQGKVQGPFPAPEMAEWYRAGYFDENLYVRRVCDSRFAALGELVKLCGNSMPFLSSHLIPPLGADISVSSVPHVNQTNQPTPQQQVSLNAKQNVVNSLMGNNDMMPSLLQLQFLQKQFLMRQQSTILSKLASSEPWPLLNSEQQQQLLNQQMSQVVLPDHLMSLSALSNSLSMVNPSTYALQQMLNAAKNDINQSKPTQQLHNPLGSFGGTDFGGQPNLHNLMQSNVPPQTNMQASPHPSGSTIDSDPIKSLLLQLQMQKIVPNAAPAPAPTLPNKWPSNVMPTQTWSVGNGAATPVSMWDFSTIHQVKPEMKTEQQILEEQLQTEKIARSSEVIKCVNDRSELSSEGGGVQTQQHQQSQHAVSQQGTPMSSQPQQQLQQLQKHSQQQVNQQQQAHSKKDSEKSTNNFEEKYQKNTKQEDEQKKGKGKGDKKENKKVLSEDERKKEAAEERKRQKEEKKRQQLEEEKKRLQQQEEEKRRQMLEEKKRQEEIDRHRRAKMLENTTLKSNKISFEKTISSSVAPWINTGLPGIAAPGPNFAEIQKAERERRAEEQRLEQILEHQRKSQMELLAQKENVLKWNAQPLKNVNVKSLVEIQAEEAKRLAEEQAAAASLEQRKKEEAAAAQSSSYGNNAFASIWNCRSGQNVAWNGKTAWTTTTNAGFWEEPTKISSTASSSNSNNNLKQQSSNNRTLSKSQTISNIQSVKKESANKQGNNNNNNKQSKIGKSNSKKDGNSSGSVGQVGSNSKKDDARNEFTSWCIKALSSMNSSVDVPTFISFLQDIESPFEIKEYIRLYLGEAKECSEFGKQFLERRSKYKNQQRAQNAHIDDMCSPAPAINPSSNEFQEVKGKGKKVKKHKMTKLDTRILGFSVTAAQDRINVGDRDYGDAS